MRKTCPACNSTRLRKNRNIGFRCGYEWRMLSDMIHNAQKTRKKPDTGISLFPQYDDDKAIIIFDKSKIPMVTEALKNIPTLTKKEQEDFLKDIWIEESFIPGEEEDKK